MYDHVAGYKDNPFPGKLFNNYNHIDVYKGTPLYYTHEEVTVDLLLAALKGGKAKAKELIGREGKVIESGPADNIFVAISDHGGPGSLVFSDRQMTAKELLKTLEDMHDSK